MNKQCKIKKFIENFLKSKAHNNNPNVFGKEINSIPRMRFTELGSIQEDSEKQENLEAMDFELKFPNDNENILIVINFYIYSIHKL